MVRMSYLRYLDFIVICYFCKNLCFSSSRAHRRQRRWVALFCSAFLLSFLFILKLPLDLPTAQSRTERGENFLFRSPIELPNVTLDWRLEATLFQSIEESTVLSNDTWITRSFKRLFCANELCLNPYIGVVKKYPKFEYVLDIGDLCSPSTPPHIPFQRDSLAAPRVLRERHSYSEQSSASRSQTRTRTKLVVLAIISGSRNRARRDAVRRTWARYSDRAHAGAASGAESSESPPSLLLDRSRFRYFFMLATPADAQVQRQLREESERFGDMVQVGIADGYFNLTLKYFAFLEWLEARCAGSAEYVVKVDDDMLVNAERLERVIDRLDCERASFERTEESGGEGSASGRLVQQPDFVLGQVNALKQRPWRLWTAKWYLPRAVYPPDNFPAYAYGCLYVMSWGVVTQSLRVGRALVPYLVWDDVFFTGTVRERARFDLLHTPDIDCTSAYSAPRSLTRRLPLQTDSQLALAAQPDNDVPRSSSESPHTLPASLSDPMGDALGLMTANPEDLEVAWQLLLARHNTSSSAAEKLQLKRTPTAARVERWEAWRTWPGRDLIDFAQKDPFMFLFGVDM